jgi:hypothetical protein
MSPETFLSLHIFADERHPSAHGGRGKDGLSLWSIFNKTKTRFGEKLLRGWFARPTQDLDTLRERHDALEFLTAAPNAQLHAQLHGLVGKMKDISKIESSLSRGGLLLSDYTATLATASYAVKVAEMLLAAEVPQTLPFVRRALAAIDRELYMVSNTIASVIDFEASGAARSKAMVGGSHIVVREGVEALLDKLREEYAEITPVLDAVAAEERGRLARIGRLPPSGELYLVYVAQLGFLLRLPLPAMDAAEAERAGLVSRVVAADQLMSETLAAAATICSQSAPSVMMAKECINRAFESGLSDGVSHERRLFHSLFGTHDQREGMAAFIAKRKPDFKQS